jgi:hypothetical protein
MEASDQIYEAALITDLSSSTQTPVRKWLLSLRSGLSENRQIQLRDQICSPPDDDLVRAVRCLQAGGTDVVIAFFFKEIQQTDERSPRVGVLSGSDICEEWRRRRAPEILEHIGFFEARLRSLRRLLGSISKVLNTALVLGPPLILSSLSGSPTKKAVASFVLSLLQFENVLNTDSTEGRINRLAALGSGSGVVAALAQTSDYNRLAWITTVVQLSCTEIQLLSAAGRRHDLVAKKGFLSSGFTDWVAWLFGGVASHVYHHSIAAPLVGLVNARLLADASKTVEKLETGVALGEERSRLLLCLGTWNDRYKNFQNFDEKVRYLVASGALRAPALPPPHSRNKRLRQMALEMDSPGSSFARARRILSGVIGLTAVMQHKLLGLKNLEALDAIDRAFKRYLETDIRESLTDVGDTLSRSTLRVAGLSDDPPENLDYSRNDDGVGDDDDDETDVTGETRDDLRERVGAVQDPNAATEKRSDPTQRTSRATTLSAAELRQEMYDILLGHRDARPYFRALHFLDAEGRLRDAASMLAAIQLTYDNFI